MEFETVRDCKIMLREVVPHARRIFPAAEQYRMAPLLKQLRTALLSEEAEQTGNRPKKMTDLDEGRILSSKTKYLCLSIYSIYRQQLQVSAAKNSLS
jgi:hypothetical protein